ncbi:hypothetical protein [Caldalkalibacillus salinus]|uniref:hypothetical protein n=1 Tax=Caldalkalibacillus salinus TaxID=2803787 RepID=UPI0019247CAD|nr:hypothetical protein [Caldalkalibacillus salinus]
MMDPCVLSRLDHLEQIKQVLQQAYGQVSIQFKRTEDGETLIEVLLPQSGYLSSVHAHALQQYTVDGLLDIIQQNLIEVDVERYTKDREALSFLYTRDLRYK